ncbi:hypothetical protein FA13DRAFT_1032026 [Coprinellus micaceus]|uniref:Uncharacterized protein n=1 Tax=Coprinellus micaceus TaxID=71717 RepID=A0A4Y7RP22_COPMI|nr:hypothetical protein FA13DRAFT_1032026 [Coprinellus micaceus]
MDAVPCLPGNSGTWRAAIIWRRRSAQPQASNLRLRTQERRRLSAKRSPFATSQFRVSAAPDRTSSNTRSFRPHLQAPTALVAPIQCHPDNPLHLRTLSLGPSVVRWLPPQLSSSGRSRLETPSQRS